MSNMSEKDQETRQRRKIDLKKEKAKINRYSFDSDDSTCELPPTQMVVKNTINNREYLKLY